MRRFGFCQPDPRRGPFFLAAETLVAQVLDVLVPSIGGSMEGRRSQSETHELDHGAYRLSIHPALHCPQRPLNSCRCRNVVTLAPVPLGAPRATAKPRMIIPSKLPAFEAFASDVVRCSRCKTLNRGIWKTSNTFRNRPLHRLGKYCPDTPDECEAYTFRPSTSVVPPRSPSVPTSCGKTLMEIDNIQLVSAHHNNAGCAHRLPYV